MRWGIRRSNPSGGGPISSRIKKTTPDQIGKAKSAADEGSKIAKEGVNITKSIGDIRSARRKEDFSNLSDSELRARIDRLTLEQRYATLSGSQVSKGQVYAKSAMEVTGSVLAIGSSAMAIALAMKKIKE
jgi:hypothetical protein